VFTEVDFRSPTASGLSFVRDYRSDGFGGSVSDDVADPWLGLGQSWTHNYAGKLRVTPTSIWVTVGQSPAQYFELPVGSTYPISLAPRRKAQRISLTQVSASTYVYKTGDNTMVVFTMSDPSVALPTAMVSSSGWVTTLTNNAAGVQAATEVSGRALQFGYDAIGHLTSVTDPAGQAIQYTYKLADLAVGEPYNGNEFTTLSAVTFQDQRLRQYLTPNWSANKSFATRITGIVDELGAAYETIEYVPYYGQVQSTELAGGVDRYSVAGNAVTDPLGSTRNLIFDGSQSGPFNVLIRSYQPAGAGCAAGSSYFDYDSATGNATSKDDFTGNRTCYAYDAAGRNVETARVEGLTTSAACSAVTPANAVLPVGSRKVSTLWHPDWRLETKLAEPGRLTTSVYNGQPDPFNSNALASCAPVTALLPDGKPIAVLCKRVEQATTDANGSLGFTAALQSGVANRVSTWTYNQYGQVLTAKSPRTDVNATTTYTYYTDTVFTGTDPNSVGHTIGDLQTVTNAVGKVTTYTKYDKHGQVLEMSDPNGVVTTNTYDLRQRLLSTSVGGQTTSYTYDAAGQLLKVTSPDTSWVGYEYDPAHRQTAVKDNRGNRIEYTLDNAGNKTAESVKDPGGNLRRTLSRSIDALGRVQQTTGRE
jgi:YD repeat-containing protein